MLRGVKSILGYKVMVNEGQCGLVHDFLFDDQLWQITHLVVRIGPSPQTLRLFPLSPAKLRYIFPESQTFVLRVNSASVLSSPPIDADPPVSRQRKRRFSALKIYVPFLPTQLPGVFVPTAFAPTWISERTPDPSAEVTEDEQARWNPNLRSAQEVIGYRAQALDGRAGVVEDFLFDDHDLSLRHLVVLTRRFVLRKKVLVSTNEVVGIGWELARVNLSADRKSLRVRRSV